MALTQPTGLPPDMSPHPTLLNTSQLPSFDSLQALSVSQERVTSLAFNHTGDWVAGEPLPPSLQGRTPGKRLVTGHIIFQRSL